MGLSNYNCKKKDSVSNFSDRNNTNSTGDLESVETGAILFGTSLVLCGANVNGKPNFNVLGNFGIISLKKPRPIIYVSSNPGHYTNIGIRENSEFSVCFPVAEIIAKTDYCGVFSGHKVDKSKIFNVQYGQLKNAPLIKECNVCFACKVVQQLTVNGMEVFFGEIIEKFASTSCLVNGVVDHDKINAVAYGPGNAYRLVDQTVGIPWSEFKNYSKG